MNTDAVVHDPHVRLLVPDEDVAEPELSIVVPALDEELTVSDFVAWCRKGLAAAGVVGEVLIVDSSTDRTPELALAAGARYFGHPGEGWGARTSTRCRTCAGSGS